MGYSDVIPLQELVYLELSIGTSTKSTRKLPVARTKLNIRNIRKRQLAKEYNAVYPPHVLCYVPFWDSSNQIDKVFYCFKK